jgi:hypothetical protein
MALRRWAWALAAAGLLFVGACSSDDGGEDGGGSGAQPASEAGDESGGGDEGDDEAFCAEVEQQIDTATGNDLLEAYPAIEAMADAAPEDLQDAFEENLVALEPAARAEDADEAREVFIEEVAPNEAYTDSLAELGDAIDERCGIDIDEPAG